MNPEVEFVFILLGGLGCVHLVASITSKYLEMRWRWQLHKALMASGKIVVPPSPIPTVDLRQGEYAQL